MQTSALDSHSVKKLISYGDIHEAMENLIQFTETTTIDMATEIYHTSARYRRLESEKKKGEISSQDYKLEYNSITLSLLEIADSIAEIDPRYMAQVASKDELRSEIETLADAFHEADRIRSNASRLRTKIHLARKMAEKLAQRPILIKEFEHTKDQAIICAIGRKIKMVPDIEELDILETLTYNADNNVTKGFITNALAELIYSGQLRIGDDEIMRRILHELGKEGDKVLLTNVTRVEAALDFLTG
ncbi:MAG: hypothetical protein AAF388_27680, partial [Bacteroidota bacterium]